MTLTQALIEDDTASILGVWFNQPFLAKVLKKNEYFILDNPFISYEEKGLIKSNKIANKQT